MPGSLDFDCMNHIRNVWFGSMEKALLKTLKVILKVSLDKIDPLLQVNPSMTNIIRAVDKEFSLSANYPKGHGNQFLEWMREYHPGALLLHVERAAGSRQDLCSEGSMAVYMNYPFYIEFLDDMLKKANSGYTQDKDGSILQRNLLVTLTSHEMIALARLLSIMHIAVCMPFHWLAGCTHQLAVYEWGLFSMGRVIDILKANVNCI